MTTSHTTESAMETRWAPAFMLAVCFPENIATLTVPPGMVMALVACPESSVTPANGQAKTAGRPLYTTRTMVPPCSLSSSCCRRYGFVRGTAAVWTHVEIRADHRAHLCEQRIPFRMFDGLWAKIDVQIRPAEVVGRTRFNVENLGDGRVLEPRKVIKGQEQRPVSAEEPDSVWRDVGDFNVQDW